MVSPKKQLNDNNAAAADKKQAFKEGNMDNTGKINTGTQKETDKKNRNITTPKARE